MLAAVAVARQRQVRMRSYELVRAMAVMASLTASPERPSFTVAAAEVGLLAIRSAAVVLAAAATEETM